MSRGENNTGSTVIAKVNLMDKVVEFLEADNNASKMIMLTKCVEGLHNKMDSKDKKLVALDDAVNHPIDGVEPWLQQAQSQVKDTVGKVGNLEAENKLLHVELDLVKGQLLKHERKLSNHSEKLVDLTARNMSNNIMISGIPEEPFAETLTPCSPGGDRDNEQELAVKMVANVMNDGRIQSHLPIENPKMKVFYSLRFYMNLDI